MNFQLVEQELKNRLNQDEMSELQSWLQNNPILLETNHQIVEHIFAKARHIISKRKIWEPTEDEWY